VINNLAHALDAARIDAESIYEIDESPPATPRLDAPLDLRQGEQPHKETPHKSEVRAQIHQQLLWHSNTIHKNTVAAKLRSVGLGEVASRLEWCHSIFTVAQCTACGTVQKFPNRCDQFFCPECQPRLQSDRERAVKWWTREISQPKHVVLTCRNVFDFSPGHVDEFKKWFTNLRRSAFAKNWDGGFYRLEVSNRGNGFHLHLHALINARWIDQFQLSEKWKKITNGQGEIVKVKAVYGESYLKEVTKYVVKGAELAAWTPEQIAMFIAAFDGKRTFGVFGSLYGKRTQFAEWFKQIRDAKPPCKCGCTSLLFFSECEFLEKDLVAGPTQQSIPPPPIPHPEFQLAGIAAPQFGPR
jgi:hypothetical protein